jgi:hypothetical protein
MWGDDIPAGDWDGLLRKYRLAMLLGISVSGCTIKISRILPVEGL